MRRMVALALALFLGAPGLHGLSAQEDRLQRAIALVDEGEFGAAAVALDAAIRELEGQPGTEMARARAHVYLGAAYLELDQESTARTKLREALRLAPELRLDPEEFSTQVIRTFEAVRAEMPPPVKVPPATSGASAPAPVAPPTAGRAAAAEAPPRERNKDLPFILLAGGAAAAGVALAASGGGDGGANTTTTTIAVGGGATTTSTTMPPAPTTTVPPSPPPPPPSACTYSFSPGSSRYPPQAGSGTCTVSAASGCQWTAESEEDWIRITSGSGGSGGGTVGFSMDANPGGDRRGRLRLRNTATDDEPRCEFIQAGSGNLKAVSALVWTSHLDVPSGRGQVVLDGVLGSFQERLGQHAQKAPAGSHRLEAVLVSGAGPGTWRFALGGTVEPGSLRVIAGEAVAVTADAVMFRLAGRPGERVVFTFETAR